MNPDGWSKRLIHVAAFALFCLGACSPARTPTAAPPLPTGSLPASQATVTPIPTVSTATPVVLSATDTPRAPILKALTLADFAQYKTWPVVDYNIGFINPALGDAHGGHDPAYSRRIYMNPAGKKQGVSYAIGTILVKETFTWGTGGKQQFADSLWAMVKRGGDFNPAGGGWEWYEIAPNLAYIASHGGANMMDGRCNACHALAQAPGGGDYVFQHPEDYVATATDFADYKTWTLISAGTAPPAILGQGHQGGAGQLHVYKRQALANPDTAAGYPGGTILVAEVEQNGAVQEVTAMVKRAGQFNPQHAGWEWFVLDPSKLSIVTRGADVPSGSCNECHNAAQTAANGKDYVFKQPNDPFNK